MSLTPSNSNVKLWLELSEGSGTTANDSSGEGNNGTISGAVYDKVVNGGYTLNFDGTDDYVDCGDNLEFTNGETITISVWINPDNISNGEEVVAKKYNYGFGMWDTGRLTFAFYPSSGDQIYATAQNIIIASEWQHIVVTYTFGTGSSCKLYRNGVEISGTWKYGTGNVSPPSNNNHLMISPNSGYLGSFFPGQIRQPIILNTTLTASQVKKLYQDTYIN